MAVCTNCGTPNPDGSKFCTGCGAPLVGADIAADVAAAAAAVIPDAPAAPEIPVPADPAVPEAPAPTQPEAPVPELTIDPPQPDFSAPQPTYTPPQPDFSTAQPAYAAQQPVYNAPQSVAPVSTGGLLAWAIISILLCTIPGIVALIKVLGINNSATVEEQQQKLSSAKTWCIVATVLGAVALIANIGLRATGRIG